MIDKVQRIVRMMSITSFAVVIAGCWAVQPLKQPPPNLAVVTLPSADTIEESGEIFQCAEDTNDAPKKVAILHIGMDHPEESRLFPQFQTLFTKRLLLKAKIDSPQHFRNMTHVTLKPHQISQLGMVNQDMRSQVREVGKQFDSQIIVSGSISKIEMSQNFNPDKSKDAHPLDNISGVIDRLSDELSAITWRKVSFKLQIFDGANGDSLFETETEQKISLKSGEHFFLLASSTDQLKREREMIEAIDSLIAKQLEIIDEVAACTPVRASIIATDNVTATINVGSRSQASVGDQFGLFQSRLIHTDLSGTEHLFEEQVGSLRITSVQADSATGQIENLQRTAEIHRGDLVIRR